MFTAVDDSLHLADRRVDRRAQGAAVGERLSAVLRQDRRLPGIDRRADHGRALGPGQPRHRLPDVDGRDGRLVAVVMFLFCFATTTERVEHEIDYQPLREQARCCCERPVAGARRRVHHRHDRVRHPGRGRPRTTRSTTWAATPKMHLRIPQHRGRRRDPGDGGVDLDHQASTARSSCSADAQLLVGLSAPHVRDGGAGRRGVGVRLLLRAVLRRRPARSGVLVGHRRGGRLRPGKSGKRVSGLGFGGISFFQKTGMGVAGAFVGWDC